MKHIYLTCTLIWINICCFAQLGGQHVYEFINLSPSARITALGGNVIAVKDNDVALAYANPASLNESMLHRLSVSTASYFKGTDIFHGYAAYAYKVGKANLLLHSGIQMISYGGFDKRDVYGNDQGAFSASEYAITTGTSRPLTDKITLGLNFKFIISQLANYTSLGFSSDVAGMYYDEEKQLTASLLVKNVGAQITSYNERNEEIPFEIQLGFSKRLKHLPLRFGVTAIHLERWNIRFDNEEETATTNLFGEVNNQKTGTQKFFDNLFRHFAFNAEFLFGKKDNFNLRAGYNPLRRAELSLNDLRSMAGFSLGTGFKVKRFKVDYGIGFYHIGATIHHFSLSTNF